MSAYFDEELGGWVCAQCKNLFNINCPLCKGLGNYYKGFDYFDCDCCGCDIDYII